MSLHFKAGTLSELKDRKATFIASDESEDRMGDIIRAKGWELSEFRKNPVLLWGHNASELPIGIVEDIRVVGKQLMADVVFATKELNPFADHVFQMVKAGIIRAVSVGFSPDETKVRLDKKGNFLGYEFLKQQLHELSVVNVPANANALAVAKQLHISERDHRKLFGDSVTSDAIKRERENLAIAKVKAHLCACTS